MALFLMEQSMMNKSYGCFGGWDSIGAAISIAVFRKACQE
jgi:hypothetical protein